MKRFSDFAKTEGLEGDKVQIGELFNKEVIITGFRIMPSKCRGITDKDCLQIQFAYTEGGSKYVVFTNSIILMRQLKEYEHEIPFMTTICKRGSYYTLS